jgi:hypothetical protein
MSACEIRSFKRNYLLVDMKRSSTTILAGWAKRTAISTKSLRIDLLTTMNTGFCASKPTVSGRQSWIAWRSSEQLSHPFFAAAHTALKGLSMFPSSKGSRSPQAEHTRLCDLRLSKEMRFDIPTHCWIRIWNGLTDDDDCNQMGEPLVSMQGS